MNNMKIRIKRDNEELFSGEQPNKIIFRDGSKGVVFTPDGHEYIIKEARVSFTNIDNTDEKEVFVEFDVE